MLCCICLIVAVCGRLCYWPAPLAGDGYMFAYMGKLIAEGGRFQHDLIDNKFPTVGLLMTLPWLLFGAGEHAYLMLQLGMGLTAPLLLARAARRRLGDDSYTPTLLVGLLLFNFAFAVGGGFQLETVQGFFAAIAAAAAMEAMAAGDGRDAFAAGLAGATAAMVKPTGAAVLAAFALAAFARQPGRSVRLMLATAAGAMLPVGATLAYLLAADNLRDMPALLRQISDYAACSAWNTGDWCKPAMAATMIGAPVLVRGWVFRRDRIDIPAAVSGPPASAGRFDRRDRVAPESDRLKRVGRCEELFAVRVFVLAWLGLEATGVVLQRRMYPYHFLPLACPAALLLGMIPRRDRLLSNLATVAPLLVLCTASALSARQAAEQETQTPRVVAYLQSHVPPQAYVWRDRVMPVVLHTDLRSASRLPMTYLFANDDTAPLRFSQILLEDFSQHRPLYVLLPADMNAYLRRYCGGLKELAAFPVRRRNFALAWRQIDRYVQARYVRQATLGDEAIYRLRPAPAAVTASSAD